MELEHRSPIVFDDSAIAALSEHPLPGNVRELENLVERLAILFPGETITNQKLPQRYQSQGALPQATAEAEHHMPALDSVQLFDMNKGMDIKQYLTNLEKSIIERALENADWIVARAAKSLSLQRTTLVEKIKKLDIQNSVM